MVAGSNPVSAGTIGCWSASVADRASRPTRAASWASHVRRAESRTLLYVPLMRRRRRPLALVLAAVLGASLTAAPANASAGARGTLVVPYAPARMLDLVLERREDDGTWRRVDAFSGDDLAARVIGDTAEVDVPAGDYRVSQQRDPQKVHHVAQPDLTTTYLPDVETAADAEVVSLGPGQRIDLSAFEALPGGHVTGTARREDGSRLPENARIEALQHLGPRRGWTVVEVAYLTADGFFDVGGLASGPTVLRVFAGSVTSGGAVAGPDAETFSGGVTSFDAASRISVTAGTSVTAEPIAVRANGTLSGIVRDADGIPLAGVEVDVGDARRTVVTATDGSWTVGPLRAGTYEVDLSDPQSRVTYARRVTTVDLGSLTVLQTDLPHHAPLWRVDPTLDGGPWSVPWDEPLTVDPGVLVQDDAVVTDVTWFEGAGPDRVAVGTGPTYTPPRSLDGAFVSAEVTAARKGLVSRLATSAVEVRDPEFFVGRPTQSSTAPVAHELLEARRGTVSPAPARTSWQWLRDGRPIPGAVGTRYRTTAADIGRTVVARATVHRRGYATAVLRSTARRVASARSVTRATVRPRGHARVALSATVSVPRVSSAMVDGALEVYRAGSRPVLVGSVEVVDGRAAATLPRQPKGARSYWVRFRPSRDGMLPSTSARARTTVR